MKKTWLGGVLLCMIGSIQAQQYVNWAHDCATLETVSTRAEGNKFRVHENTRLELFPGNAIKASSAGGNSSFSRLVPCHFSMGMERGYDYLQLRITECSPNVYLYMTTSKGGPFLSYTGMKPGLFTIPVNGPWLKNMKKPKDNLTFNFYIGGNPGFTEPPSVVFNLLRMVNAEAVDGVFLSAKKGDGTTLEHGGLLTSGDILTVEMPVAAKPDALRLSFFKVNRGKDWSKTSRWEVLDLPGAPVELKAVPGKPDLYRASFTLPQMNVPLDLELNSLIAAVEYVGADSRNYGMFYGIAPFSVKLAAGKNVSTQKKNFFFLTSARMEASFRMEPWLSGRGMCPKTSAGSGNL